MKYVKQLEELVEAYQLNNDNVHGTSYRNAPKWVEDCKFMATRVKDVFDNNKCILARPGYDVTVTVNDGDYLIKTVGGVDVAKKEHFEANYKPMYGDYFLNPTIEFIQKNRKLTPESALIESLEDELKTYAKIIEKLVREGE